jgi:hypothetical protein
MISAPCRAAALRALAAVACLLVAACSPGADYPSLFPSVHDIPPARADTPLDSNQVQQATEDLITARERLTAEAQSGQAKSATGSPDKAATKSPAKSAGASAGKSSGNAATAGHQAGARATLGTEAAPAGGTETK